MPHPPDGPAVLVIEPEPLVRQTVALLLDRLGRRAVTPPGRKQAVEEYRRDPAAVGVVLLDVRPGNRAGPDTLTELRRCYPHVRCCAMTTDPQPEADAGLHALGVGAVVSKPFDLARLAAALTAAESAARPTLTPDRNHPHVCATPTMPPARPAHRLSVLVVDDCPDTTASTVQILNLVGFDATEAGTGRAAVAAADGSPPDVVLLDLDLADMDGCEVARRLRERAADKRPFLVAVTGCVTDADRRRTADAGIDLHLAKPVAPADLVAVLDRFARVVVR